jgi:peptidoglycan/xylan/chitin deacetylase (PgdA/CDA1 family)
MSGLKTMKHLCLHTCKGLGMYRMSQNSRWRSRRLLILCYHGISIEDEHEWRPTLFMPLDNFEARLELLKTRGYNVLPLHEAVDRLYAEDLPDRSVAITFDDGGYDFYRRAHPVLRSFGYASTVYLTTFYCDYNRPIFNLICSYMLWKRRDRVFDARNFAGSDLMITLATNRGRDAALEVLLTFADREHLSAEEKDRLAERIASDLGIDYEELLAKRILHLMNRREVAELSADGVDFQLHTHRHRTPRDRDLYVKEILDNRERIEEMTEIRPSHFCYPSGIYQRQFLPWLRDVQVTTATTCDPGMVTRHSDPLLLPRLVDSTNLAPVEFEGWLSGVASFLPRRGANAQEVF